MAPPASVTTRVVRGTYIDNTGTPQRGMVTFRVDQPLIATVESWGVTPGPIEATLDSSGTFSVSLMASDDVDLFPSGFRYIVQERFQKGYVRTYAIELPSAADPFDLPTATQYDPGDAGLAVVHSINGMTGIVQITPTSLGAIPLTQKAAANGVPSLDSSGKIPVSQLPAGTAGVTSVDGRTGVVVLTDLYSGTGHTHAYPVTSVNSKTGAVVLTPADVGAVSAGLLGANSGVATLDSGGKLLGAQVPSVAILDVFDAADQAAMLALSAQKGDMARRADTSSTFVLTASDPSVLANWKELPTPPDAVASVNGKTGAVSLAPSDVGAVPVASVGAASGVASLDSSVLVPLAQIPSLPASRIGSGLLDFNRLPTGATSTTVAVGNHTHDYIPTSARGQASGVAALDSGGLVPVSQVPALDAAKVTTGILDVARLPVGTSGTTVAVGDHAHDYISTSEKGQPNGVATLDGTSRLPVSSLPLNVTRSVLIGPSEQVPTTLPPGGLVLRYDQTPWTQITLEGVWDGADIIPIAVAASV